MTSASYRLRRWYLSTPYTNLPGADFERWLHSGNELARVASQLDLNPVWKWEHVQIGCLWSPVYESMHHVKAGTFPTDWDGAMEWCLSRARHFTGLILAPVEGIASRGMEAERDFFSAQGLPLLELAPTDYKPWRSPPSGWRGW